MKSKRNKRSARKPLTAIEINRSWDMVRKSVDETKNHNGVCNCDLSLALSSLINDAELIKKFPNPPKDEDLITPIFIPGWISIYNSTCKWNYVLFKRYNKSRIRS